MGRNPGKLCLHLNKMIIQKWMTLLSSDKTRQQFSQYLWQGWSSDLRCLCSRAWTTWGRRMEMIQGNCEMWKEDDRYLHSTLWGETQESIISTWTKWSSRNGWLSFPRTRQDTAVPITHWSHAMGSIDWKKTWYPDSCNVPFQLPCNAKERPSQGFECLPMSQITLTTKIRDTTGLHLYMEMWRRLSLRTSRNQRESMLPCPTTLMRTSITTWLLEDLLLPSSSSSIKPWWIGTRRNKLLSRLLPLVQNSSLQGLLSIRSLTSEWLFVISAFLFE